MEYYFQEFTVKELLSLIETDKIDLNPSYQRNFIWSPDNQKELIDTILKKYPLPSFFFYLKPDNSYEMVDGQQRSRTIYRFIKGEITSSKLFNRARFSDVDQSAFFLYRITVIVISNLSASDSLNDFYVLINKKGVHLNIAEMNKSEFHDSSFLKLANELLTFQKLINLDLFTENASKRMNDRSFIEELLGYLLQGIKDKKKSVEETFRRGLTPEEIDTLNVKFKRVIERIDYLNNIKLISQTRYKQKNDFYTLFSFVEENLSEDFSTLAYQYEILVVFDGTDNEGRQFIRPSNDDCYAFKEYANNCVTQSNSKSARGQRLQFFNSVLKNKSEEGNDTLNNILEYFATIFGEDKVRLRSISSYHLLDTKLLQ